MTANEVLILEDDATMRAMLRVVLKKAGYEPLFFADGEALIAKARDTTPACILLDLCLPRQSGLDVLGELAHRSYSAPILMVSGQGDIATAVRALRIGAADFVEKPFSPTDLIARIVSAGAGEPVRSAGSIAQFKHSRRLSKRESEILDHLLAGSTTKMIARKLGISPRTVEDHRASIMRKARVKSMAQLSVMAFEGARVLKNRLADPARGTLH
ncbi:response regulator transcription factor [Bradyrhizobium manausense]|uniref:response regulator transcription factor n=1 Tax=Bradyrhizobium manausense TaxID=989370 RepID=UPI001BA6B9E6|nr:response regulator [Bradyrhizobium manausense]MBR1090643.1 response regulator transcription factor [Bradyrhizobium manausense]